MDGSAVRITVGLMGSTAILSALHIWTGRGFSRSDYPLHEVRTVGWEGHLFLNLTITRSRLQLNGKPD